MTTGSQQFYKKGCQACPGIFCVCDYIGFVISLIENVEIAGLDGMFIALLIDRDKRRTMSATDEKSYGRHAGKRFPKSKQKESEVWFARAGWNQERMSKVLFVEPEKCTGCRSCELICSFVHAGEFNPLRSRISIVAFEKTGFSFPAVCQQCSVAACMEVCPVGAISVDDATGAKIVNHGICLRCKMCTIACPFGATFYDADHDLIIKCDLCGGDPECVKYCPSAAISYREAKTANFNKRRSTAEKFKELMEEGRS